MISIDNFIKQLILSGLADSFLDVIQKHYLKIIAVYNIIDFIEESNVIGVDSSLDELEDSLTITIYLKDKITKDLYLVNDDFVIQANNYGDKISITVINKFGSEDDIYETRLNGCEKGNSSKWS